MNSSDDKLKSLLAQWRNIDPPQDFDSAVWRRIRGTSLEGPGWLEEIRAWVWTQPAWATVLAVVVGMAMGGYAGFSRAPDRGQVALLRPGTLAGNYVSMVSGGAP
jgi:hypothetical protein